MELTIKWETPGDIALECLLLGYQIVYGLGCSWNSYSSLFKLNYTVVRKLSQFPITDSRSEEKKEEPGNGVH